MKEKILKLRKLGKSYKEISNVLGCSKSLINYYCSKDGKEKVLERSRDKKELKNNFRNKRSSFLKSFVWRHKRFCGCSDCGIKDPRVLDYDHKDNVEKIDNISKMVNRGNSINTIKKEIRKCTVLCANCHRIRTSVQLNYYTEI